MTTLDRIYLLNNAFHIDFIVVNFFYKVDSKCDVMMNKPIQRLI